MNNFDDLLNNETLLDGNLLDLSQQMDLLDTSQVDLLQDQALGIDDSASSNGYLAEYGRIENELDVTAYEMPQVTDADWANFTDVNETDVSKGFQEQNFSVMDSMPRDLTTLMDTDNFEIPHVTDADWVNFTHANQSSEDYSAQSLGEPNHTIIDSVGHPVFASDCTSSGYNVDDIGINSSSGWVYKDGKHIGYIKDGSVYDSHNKYVGYYEPGGEVYTPEGKLLAKVMPNGDEYDPDGNKIGHISGTQYLMPKGAADILLMRVPQQW